MTGYYASIKKELTNRGLEVVSITHETSPSAFGRIYFKIILKGVGSKVERFAARQCLIHCAHTITWINTCPKCEGCGLQNAQGEEADSCSQCNGKGLVEMK